MAQTGRSNVRYVDPQRRYTIVLGPSWDASFEALPHNDRAGTHDSADGRSGSYASIGRGQAATKLCRRYPQGRPISESAHIGAIPSSPTFSRRPLSPLLLDCGCNGLASVTSEKCRFCCKTILGDISIRSMSARGSTAAVSGTRALGLLRLRHPTLSGHVGMSHSCQLQT
jgi:hypothetical protein